MSREYCDGILSELRDPVAEYNAKFKSETGMPIELAGIANT